MRPLVLYFVSALLLLLFSLYTYDAYHISGAHTNASHSWRTTTILDESTQMYSYVVSGGGIGFTGGNSTVSSSLSTTSSAVTTVSGTPTTTTAQTKSTTPTTSLTTTSTTTTTVPNVITSTTPATTMPQNSLQNFTTSFYGAGLPQNALWSVYLGGVLRSSTSVFINFTGQSANTVYSVLIPNVTYQNSTFAPSPNSGNVVSGFEYRIAFNALAKATSGTNSIMTTVDQSPSNNFTGAQSEILITNATNMLRERLRGRTLDGITVNLTAAGLYLSINVLNRTTVPSGYAPVPSPVYSFIRINGTATKDGVVNNIDNYISNVTYNFSVPIDWVQQQHISSGNIRLFKYVQGNWTALPTSYVGSNTTSYFYSALSSSFSGYVVGYTTANTVSVSDTITLAATSGYTTYFFGVGYSAMSGAGPLPSLISWTNDTNMTLVLNSGKPGDRYANYSSIGHQTSSSGTFTLGSGASAYDGALSAVGANVVFTGNNVNGVLFLKNGTGSQSLTYSVTAANSFVVLVMTDGGSVFTSNPTPPSSGCTWVTSQAEESTFAEAEVAVCSASTSGSKTISFTSSKTADAAGAIAAYVFPPYSITLDDSPTTGNILTGGVTYSNGAKANLIGTNTLIANAPYGYTFNSWSTSSTSNIIIANTLSDNTAVTIEGSGTVTANYITYFNVSLSSCPTAILLDSGQSVSCTAITSNGVTPYTYNWLVSALNNLQYIVANQLYSGLTLSSNTVTFTTNSLFVDHSPEQFNVTVTDGSSVTINSTYSGNFQVASALAPSCNLPGTSDSGQWYTLTCSWAGGWANYNAIWYIGAPGNSCAQDSSNVLASYNGIAVLSHSLLVSPTTSNSYCIKVSDSATTPETANSVSGNIVVDSALSVTASPATNTVTQGANAVISGSVSGGTASYFYQWLAEAPLGSMTACTNNWQGGTCAGNVLTYTQNTVLSSDIDALVNITVNSGVTLTTNGYAIWISGNLINNGNVMAGNTIPNRGSSSLNVNQPLSFAGSGAGGGGGGIGYNGNIGNSTLADGGGGGFESGNGGNGGTPAAPSITNANIVNWEGSNDFVNYFLSGTGGNGGVSGLCPGGNCYNRGGNPSYGLYIQASDIVNSGNIIATGFSGSNPNSNPTGGGGGSGGGFVLLSYNGVCTGCAANTIVTGGSGGTGYFGGGNGGTGGNGNVVTYNYGNSPPLVPGLSAAEGNALCGNTANTINCNFATNSLTATGNYIFMLRVTDSATFPVTVDSGLANVIVQSPSNNCQISLSPGAISFGSLNPTASTATQDTITDKNNGNIAANILIYGTNWIGTGSNAFGVSNTVWSGTLNLPFASANALTSSAILTLLTVGSSSSANIFIGAEVPGGAAGGIYTQNIIIENSC